VIAAARAIDTVGMARAKFPGAPASLDALCKRFMIDNAARSLHGALLDAQLLAEVYLELIGGRQPGLALAAIAASDESVVVEIVHRAPRPHAASEAELAAHAEFLKKIVNPIWLRQS
jgi:DNA polymerase-3 subunit epsilon